MAGMVYSRNMAEYSIGLDLGGTNLRAAAIDKTGKMLDKVSGRTQYSEGREAIVHDMVEAISGLRDRFGKEHLSGIGIGVPGFISLKDGVIKNCANIPTLENFPIRDEIGRRLETTVILENDANAAALGEKWIGAGRDVDDLVMLHYRGTLRQPLRLRQFRLR
jgi:glucokinase